MLSFRSLSCSFGNKRAVNDVSFELPGGALVGIIGGSGAGKSTLLRSVNRMVDPSSGRIEWNGRDITALRGRELRAWRGSCAMIFQQFNLIERLDVLTNVLAGRLAHHGFVTSMLMRFSDAERAAALEALARLGLAEYALQLSGTLSGGQQQRVAIARALMQQPGIVLADEPVASLDPANALKVMDSLRAINREDGITVLVNLHHLDIARTYCDCIVAMREGRVVFQGTPAQLTEDLLATIYGSETETPSAGAKTLAPAA